MKTWGTDDTGRKTCPNCGSIYAVKITRLPLKDKDFFDCQVCGH